MGTLSIFTRDSDNVGLLYGVVTKGTSNGALTAGIGWGYAGKDISNSPVLMVGGEIRAGTRTKLITENYIFPGGTILISFGPRFFGEFLSADLGLAIPLIKGEGFLLTFPIVNFVVNW